jgi:DNA-directed RNA polymerase specialized sigma24 family protein
MPRLYDDEARQARDAKICHLRETEGLTTTEIAARFDISSVRVHKILQASGQPIRRPAQRAAEIIEAAQKGASNAELLQRFAISRCRLNDILRSHGIERHGGLLADPALCPASTVEICQLFFYGMSASDIAERFGVTRGCIYQHIRKAKLRSLGLPSGTLSPGLNPIRSSSRAQLRPRSAK